MDRTTAYGPLLIAALVAIVYGPLALAGFAWDDEALVVGNTLTGSLANLPRFFQVDLWETAGEAPSGYYRPMMLVGLAIDEQLWRRPDGTLWVGGLHLHSIAWHLGASLALLALLRALLPSAAALIGALLFALHPAQSEAVAWIAARNDLMAAALLLLSLRVLLPADARPARCAAGAALAALALFSKENAVLGLLGLPLLDWALHGRPRGPARYLSLAAAAAIWWSARAWAGVALEDVSSGAGLRILADRWHELAAWYSLKIAIPWPLTVGETLEYLDLPAARVALGWLLALSALSAPLVVWRRGAHRREARLALAGLILAGVTFAPALAAIAIRGPIGERYLYAPMAGLGLWLAAMASTALPADTPARAIRRASLAAGATALVYMGILADRVPEWFDGLSLWTAAAEDSPNGYSYTILGHELNIDDQPEAALQLWRMALADSPPYLDACPNFVRLPLRRGWIELAVQNGAIAREAGCPETPEQAGLYASALAQAGQWEVARAFARADDPAGRGPLILLALAALDGDRARFLALAEPLGVPLDELEPRVRSLLAAGGVGDVWFQPSEPVEGGVPIE